MTGCVIRRAARLDLLLAAWMTMIMEVSLGEHRLLGTYRECTMFRSNGRA